MRGTSTPNPPARWRPSSGPASITPSGVVAEPQARGNSTGAAGITASSGSSTAAVPGDVMYPATSAAAVPASLLRGVSPVKPVVLVTALLVASMALLETLQDSQARKREAAPLRASREASLALSPPSGHRYRYDVSRTALQEFASQMDKARVDYIASGDPWRSPSDPPCRGNRDAFPGRAHSPTNDLGDVAWEPRKACRIHRFQAGEAQRCLAGRGKRIAFFGDSVLHGAVKGLAWRAGLEARLMGTEDGRWRARPNEGLFHPGAPASATPVAGFFWTPSVFIGDPSDRAARPNASRWLREADIVFLHHQLWDIGHTCQGVYPYYYALKQRVAKLKGAMKPGAQLVLFEMPYTYPAKCDPKKGVFGMCFEYNREDKSAVYRDALRVAAACTKTPLYTHAGVTEAFPTHSRDGIHFEVGPVYSLTGDILLNTLCSRGDHPPMEFADPGVCDQRAAQARWSATPRALYCPSTLGLRPL